MEAPVVSVCIATYKRPKSLERLLRSLASQEVDRGVLTFEIIVVDNDGDGSARPVVETFARKNGYLSVIYDIEPEQNISLARNRSVRHAKGDYIAFIDDDEEAANDWLKQLVTCMQKYSADAVFGPVKARLPVDCPAWLRRGGFFEKPTSPDGEVLTVGRTSNALVKKYWVQEVSTPFDPAFGLTGGGDSDFFRRIQGRGAKLCAAEHAMVFETIEPRRLRLSWLLARAFRGGQGYATQQLAKSGVFAKVRHILYRWCLTMAAMLLAVLSTPLGRHRAVYWLMKCVANIGQLSVFLPFRYQEYKRAGQ